MQKRHYQTQIDSIPDIQLDKEHEILSKFLIIPSISSHHYLHIVRWTGPRWDWHRLRVENNPRQNIQDEELKLIVLVEPVQIASTVATRVNKQNNLAQPVEGKKQAYSPWLSHPLRTQTCLQYASPCQNPSQPHLQLQPILHPADQGMLRQVHQSQQKCSIQHVAGHKSGYLHADDPLHQLDSTRGQAGGDWEDSGWDLGAGIQDGKHFGQLWV